MHSEKAEFVFMLKLTAALLLLGAVMGLTIAAIGEGLKQHQVVQ